MGIRIMCKAIYTILAFSFLTLVYVSGKAVGDHTSFLVAQNEGAEKIRSSIAENNEIDENDEGDDEDYDEDDDDDEDEDDDTENDNRSNEKVERKKESEKKKDKVRDVSVLEKAKA